ncbi:hypothetical protein fugu_005177 [Takifugu bimaculatus]|uniref:Uncharacterized protein n=1 Tax=Takifugu bimaculatus TaxID=433685 RepID=A0A4Z2B998_9TELE|nr:hypothetical protein fugu_005177 [Takifugu bimaculatus]
MLVRFSLRTVMLSRDLSQIRMSVFLWKIRPPSGNLTSVELPRVSGKFPSVPDSRDRSRTIMIVIVDLLLMLINLTCSILNAVVQTFLRPRLKSIDGELCLITGAGGALGRLFALEFAKEGSAPGAVGLQRAGQRAHGRAGAGARSSGAHAHGGRVRAPEHLRDGGQGESGGRGGHHPGQQHRSGGGPQAAGLSRRASGEDTAGQLPRAVLGETCLN